LRNNLNHFSGLVLDWNQVLDMLQDKIKTSKTSFETSLNRKLSCFVLHHWWNM